VHSTQYSCAIQVQIWWWCDRYLAFVTYSAMAQSWEGETLCSATGYTTRRQSTFLSSNPCKNGCGTPTTDFLSVVVGVPQPFLQVSAVLQCNLTWYPISPCNYTKSRSTCTAWLRAYKHICIPMKLPVRMTMPLAVTSHHRGQQWWQASVTGTSAVRDHWAWLASRTMLYVLQINFMYCNKTSAQATN
jgi:hypothetical protein